MWREAKQYHIMTDDSPSRNTCNTPSFPTISDYDGLEQNTHGHNNLETNLNVSHRKKLTDIIIWEVHGFPHKFPTVRENAIKPMVWRKSGKLILILFPYYGWFFLIRFQSYGILLHMGNAWVSPSISHSTGKCNKSHRRGEPGKLVLMLFPFYGRFFSIRFRFYGICITA